MIVVGPLVLAARDKRVAAVGRSATLVGLRECRVERRTVAIGACAGGSRGMDALRSHPPVDATAHPLMTRLVQNYRSHQVGRSQQRARGAARRPVYDSGLTVRVNA